MVCEKNGALKLTYYYFGWEQLNHFIPLCASFLHFHKVIGAHRCGGALTKPKDTMRRRNRAFAHYNASSVSKPSARLWSHTYNVTYFKFHGLGPLLSSIDRHVLLYSLSYYLSCRMGL